MAWRSESAPVGMGFQNLFFIWYNFLITEKRTKNNFVNNLTHYFYITFYHKITLQNYIQKASLFCKSKCITSLLDDILI